LVQANGGQDPKRMLVSIKPMLPEDCGARLFGHRHAGHLVMAGSQEKLGPTQTKTAADILPMAKKGKAEARSVSTILSDQPI